MPVSLPSEFSDTTHTVQSDSIRAKPFTTINVIPKATNATILSTTVTLVGSAEPGIVIVNGTTSATISGYYDNKFNDVITYVSALSSDKEETPTVVSGFGNLPPNKNVISFVQDLTQHQVVTYNVTVVYRDIGPPPSPVDQYFYSSFIHWNKNDWSQPGIDLKNYIDAYVAYVT